MKLLYRFYKTGIKCCPLIALVLLFSFPVSSKAQSSDETQIRQMMDNQTQSWNSGNIEAFMKGYWQSDSLIFIGKNGIKYGYNTTLENYKKGYPDTASMGKLSFDLLKLKKLSSKYFYVIGKWHLQRTIGDISGSYTLLLEKIKGTWVIIADHSS